MPSSPNYKRDYQQERKTQLARGEDVGNRKRKQARRKLEAKGMVKPHDKKEIDHKNPISKGGGNSPSNLRVVSITANRAFPRNPDGSMK